MKNTITNSSFFSLTAKFPPLFFQNENCCSTINVAGDGGGSIKVHARNLELSGRSLFLGGIREDSNTPNAQAGDINIDATDNIFLNTSRIDNLVSPDAEGNSGDINIETKNLSIITSRDSFSTKKDASRISASSWGRGDAGNITINASERVSLDSGDNLSGRIQTAIERGGIGNGGDININTGSLLMIGRNQIRANTFAKGDAGNITINASEQVSLQGEFISNKARFSTMILSQERPSGEGNGGQIVINTPFLSLSDYSLISASAQSGQSGDIRITVEDLFMRNTSRINVGGTGPNPTNSNGGNLFIDARFIVAFPEQSTDIIDFPNNVILAATNGGNGGNINITATGIFGIEEREQEPGVNSINASSDFGLDGSISINIPDVNTFQTNTELPDSLIESEQTTAQACKANRESAAKNGLNITGRGGIPAEPGLPLDSQNVSINGETNSTSTIPQAIETSLGKIQPARGVKITENGTVILTAYRTNNLGERIPEGSTNCGKVTRMN